MTREQLNQANKLDWKIREAERFAELLRVPPDGITFFGEALDDANKLADLVEKQIDTMKNQFDAL